LIGDIQLSRRDGVPQAVGGLLAVDRVARPEHHRKAALGELSTDLEPNATVG
jgi:hypothetical protein